MTTITNLSQIIERKDHIWDLAKEYKSQCPSLLDLNNLMEIEYGKLSLKSDLTVVTETEYNRYYTDLGLSGCLCALLVGLDSTPKNQGEKLSLFAKVLDQLSYYLGNINMSTQEFINPFYKWFCYGEDLKCRRLGYKNSKLFISEPCKHKCNSCKEYSELGWQPLGVIPIPGFKCNSQELCRCKIKYR